MAKYHKDKSFRVTVVDGSVKTGLYAKDGSTNVVHAPLNPGGGFSTTTIPVSLDPTSVSLVTLSNGNLSATNTGTTSAAQGCMVVAAQAKTTGKWYIECKLTTYVASGGGNRGFGVGDPTSIISNMGNSATVGVMCYFSTGGIFANGVNTAITGAAGGITQGDVLQAAVDLDNRKIWFRENGGIWNNNAANNPTTNVGGITIPAGPMVPFLTFGGTVGVAGQVHTVNFGQSAFANAAPSGFNAGWTTESIVGSNTWNPADLSNITLSNGNLTATNSANASGVRGTLGRVAGMGKYYWEFLANGAFTGVGIARQSATFGTLNPMGSAVVNAAGTVYVNTGNVGIGMGALNGARVDVAVDLNAQLIWFRNSSTGLWNGNASGNPATGVFGVDISVMLTETVYPFFGTNTSAGMNVTANFGASPFSGVVPQGYVPGWAPVLSGGAKGVGTYHPCGALNVLRAPGPVSRLRAANGAMWVTTTPYANRGTKITIVSGTLP